VVKYVIRIHHREYILVYLAVLCDAPYSVHRLALTTILLRFPSISANVEPHQPNCNNPINTACLRPLPFQKSSQFNTRSYKQRGMYCRHCGTLIDDDATFCVNCGTQLGHTPSPSTPAQTQYSPNVPPPQHAPPQMTQTQKNPTLATILNFFLPGIGYWYWGFRKVAGISPVLILVIVVVVDYLLGYLASLGGLLGVAISAILAYDMYVKTKGQRGWLDAQR
jgi:hypothetical protein